LSLRRKLALGFLGLLVIITGIGVHNITRISALGESIEVILRENYRSVVACQQMKEALDRMDSGAVFVLLNAEDKGNEQIRTHQPLFEKALKTSLGNITLPGEGAAAGELERLYLQYRSSLGVLADPAVGREARRKAYFDKLLPLFQRIKEKADTIERMNQQNMVEMDARAKRLAASVRRQMYLMLIASMLLSAVFLFLTGKWILQPIRRLISSANEIRTGKLDLVVPAASRDEIGQLTEAFNEMAASLREFRRTDQAKLLRSQRSTQQAFDSLPDAIAVLTAEGEVEVATKAAVEMFGLRPGSRVRDAAFPWMADITGLALSKGCPVDGEGERSVIQHFVRNEERFFRPQAVPILDSSREPAGVVLVLRDVTLQRQQDEMKRSVIDAVSHQLKTPLTSVRMALHLLLEEKVGKLAPKQSELVVAASEDADRLYSIIESLLDIGHLESGRAHLDLRPVSPQELVTANADSYRSMARDAGVTLSFDVPAELPEVWVDPDRIAHVFENLLSNSLKYTPPGGGVTLSAKEEAEAVRFAVSDTGSGIPRQFLPHIFEPFFRVPGQERATGVGLGLAIVRDIVAAHGGTVGAESREGIGTTVSFSLPKTGRVAGSRGEPET
jgi:signal transduction histidine kinase/HAMP domain-containing protein